MADQRAYGRSLRQVMAGKIAAVVVSASVFLLLFALTGRAAFSLALTLGQILLIHLISATKSRLLDEPLVFSDFALIRQILRHPELYYAKAFVSPTSLLLVAALIGLAGVWWWWEPPLFDDGMWIVRLSIGAAGAALLYLVFGRARPAAVDRALADLIAKPDHAADIKRFGLFGSIILYAIRWQQGPPVPAARSPLRLGKTAPEIIIVVQIESFTDAAQSGWDGVQLAQLEEARAKSFCFGDMRPPCTGASTMRPEFEVLTGLESTELAFDQFDPYLRGEVFAGSALPRRLSAAGFDTIFLHPYDVRFFRRHRVMPAFGFARLIDEGEFSRVDRYGPYVSDRAVARRIVSEIEKARRPLFLFAVTMENHGPWRAGRLDGLGPQDQYIAHLRNADGMLGDLFAALARDRRRAALVCYGDHAPVSVDIRPFRETALTPFVVAAWRCGNTTASARTEISPARLHDVLVSLIEA